MTTTYSNGTKQRASVTAAIVALVAVVAIAGFVVGHYSASHTAASAHTVIPAKPVTPTPSATTGHTVPSGAIAAINSYETANGPGAGAWVIASSQVSSANPNYVFFRIGPATGFEASVQGGYGFAQESGVTWNVVGFGSALVGCQASGSNTAVVPSNVLAEFGFSCPPVV